MNVEPFPESCPFGPTRLEALALEAGLDPDELMAYLETEVARRRSALEELPPVVDASAEPGPGRAI